MESKHIVLFLVLYALSGCFASSLLKKWKLQVQPHGGHVADANSSTESGLSRPNSLLPSNENETPEKSKTTVAPTKKPSLSAEEKRKLRLKKKRRELKKKMRSAWKKIQISEHLSPCKGWKDCKPTECCIRHGRRGFCKKRPQKGHRCKPMLKPGLEECPCQTGSTCSHFKTNRYGLKKYRCEILRYNEEEREQP